MARRTYVTINLSALKHNFSQLKQYAKHAKVMAVVKDDAYGHGAVLVAKHMTDADALAVATLAEAIALRNAGISKKILLLSGVCSAQELQQASHHALDIVVHHEEQLRLLMYAAVMQPLHVWVKLNIGMNRLGFALSALSGVLEKLQKLVVVHQPCTLMSHFSVADDLDSQETMVQFDRVDQYIKGMALPRSHANSAAIMAWPETHGDWVRPGLMLYGLSPFRQPFECNLRPVMGFYAAIVAINQCYKGDAVGYGGLWVCPQDMPVGIVSVGYGDGYPRQPTKTGPMVRIHGQLCQTIGLASMDMIAVDLRPVPQANINDCVTLWDDTLTLNEVALSAHTVPYDLLCRVNKRVERVVID